MLRSELAGHLEATVPELSAVHAHPAEVTALPAVVIHPAPGIYWEPFVLRQGGPALVAWALVLEVLVTRTEPGPAIDHLEELAGEIMASLAEWRPVGPGGEVRFQSFGDIGEVTVGDSPAVSGQLSILVPYPIMQPEL